MARRIPLGKSRISERTRALLSGDVAPAAPRDAATVILLRPDAAGMAEVFLLRRSRGMAFAPGAHVFPGGSVDAGDSDAAVPWSGPSPEEFGARLGVEQDRARALVCAAVRETFEECGVLLAGPDRAMPVDDGHGAVDPGAVGPGAVGPGAVEPGAVGPDAGWESDRRALAAHELSLAQMLRRRGLVLRADLLTPWARWITPEAEPRRYDTFFFVAILPDGQRASVNAADVVAPGQDASANAPDGIDHREEADAAAWFTPEAALADARAGAAVLLPPTAVCLGQLTEGGQVSAIVAQQRRILPLCPTVTEAEGRIWLTIPEEVDYPL
jgi:8-oxo-dGTP pyrophosphatase MutT (NUDIX family)